MATKKNSVNTIETIVVGPASKKMAQTLAVGDSLIVRLDTYPSDPTAIKLETGDGVEVGYIAAKPSTAKGYPMAKEVYSMVKEGISVKVTSIDPLLVAIPGKAPEKAAESVKKEFYTLLSGNKLEYKNRMKVASDARKKSQLDVEFKIDNDAIIFIHEGEPCGIATKDITTTAKQTLASRGIKLNDVADIIAAINEGTSAKATINFLDGITIPVKFEVEMPAEMASISAPSKDYAKALKEFEAADVVEMQKRIDWLKANGVAEYAISSFVKRMEGHTNIQEFAPCYIPHGKEVENAIAFTHMKGNLLLVGPAGSGKNMFITTFANLMDLNLIDKSCSAGVDEESLFGFLSMKASDEVPDSAAINRAFTAFVDIMKAQTTPEEREDIAAKIAGASVDEQIDMMQAQAPEVDFSVLFDAMRSQAAQIEFEPSAITKALEKPSMINLDEVNTLRPTVTSSLHAALDKRRSILINGYKNVEINDDVIFTATMNEGSEYAGTSMLNQAFEDRWHVIEFEAPDNIAEILKQEVPTLPAKAIKVLNELYKKLKSVRGLEIQDRSFSQRAFIYAAQNIALGNDVKSAIMCTIVPKIRDAEDRESVKAIVDLMIK